MNASKRLSSSVLCHAQQNPTRLINLSKVVGTSSRCNSARIHTSTQRCTQTVNKGSNVSNTMERRLQRRAIRFAQDSSAQKASSRAFSTRLNASFHVPMVRGLHSSSGLSFGQSSGGYMLIPFFILYFEPTPSHYNHRIKNSQ